MEKLRTRRVTAKTIVMVIVIVLILTITISTNSYYNSKSLRLLFPGTGRSRRSRLSSRPILPGSCFLGQTSLKAFVAATGSCYFLWLTRHLYKVHYSRAGSCLINLAVRHHARPQIAAGVRSAQSSPGRLQTKHFKCWPSRPAGCFHTQ